MNFHSNELPLMVTYESFMGHVLLQMSIIDILSVTKFTKNDVDRVVGHSFSQSIVKVRGEGWAGEG